LHSSKPQPYTEEESSVNEKLYDYAGLLCEAQGSDFVQFMQERYVPGTWSKLAEYEHVPRYTFANQFISGGKVLDFGCGTGYGSAILADTAGSVIGLDIDAAAIKWAEQTHLNPRLSFECRNDIGKGLPDQSFDGVTCFEMIEHVDHETQIAVISNISRLLTKEGKLIISTPNPDVTALYGENPYHIREMTKNEFKELLSPFFEHFVILQQWIHPSVLIAENTFLNSAVINHMPTSIVHDRPVAFIAICSHSPLSKISGSCNFDISFDYVQFFLEQEEKKNNLNFHNYTLMETNQALENTIQSVQSELQFKDEKLNHIEEKNQALEYTIQSVQSELQFKNEKLNRIEEKNQALEHTIQSVQSELQFKNEKLNHIEDLLKDDQKKLLQSESELQAIYQTKWFRLRHVIINHSWGLKKLVDIAYLIGAMATPSFIRRKVSSLKVRFKEYGIFSRKKPFSIYNENIVHTVRHPVPSILNRPRVVHIIADFMSGRSSRFVVDLIEYLGSYYEQSVVTRAIHKPPYYLGLDITEIPFSENESLFVKHFLCIKPALIHVHYWKDFDEPWCSKVITAAEKLGIPVLQNIHRPIEPIISKAVRRYVYESDYVRQIVGKSHPSHITVYPGLDFTHFSRKSDYCLPDDCIGMVYLMEHDALNEDAILPLIRVVHKRPQTHVLIVGEDRLLESFCQAVANAGLNDRFEFIEYVNREQLPDLYSRMGIFVAPVGKENFCQFSPLAMNMRVPVVGYDVGDMREIIADQELLAEPGNPEMLSDIIVRLLESPTEREKIGEFQNLRAQEHFSLQSMIKAYQILYEELINKDNQK
jgi:glycosyltransferase involved in cell wall biosynthesis/2-polyprenyl-3-methyl-5-hydroxy-6-metoxy-1,4-benzoquinol methylase